MVQAVRGMRDVLPAEARGFRAVEEAFRSVLGRFGYEEVQLPVLEFTELFARGVGESTDIVEKEMYTLKDRDGDSLSLRPEGTAGCVRALNENGLLYNQTQRVFYAGPMFRYEKPQRGRYRQFTQIGAECFGFPGPDVDAELILLCHELWQAMGIDQGVSLEINTLGSGAARAAYRQALIDYLMPLRAELDVDSQRRLDSNPLRILDSKDAKTQGIVATAPRLESFIDSQGLEHFDRLQGYLTALGVPFTVNPTLVRGLDYYTHTVFEWTTTELGAQGTVCGGGRYDGLVEKLGGKPTPAAGFGMGLDRVVLLYETLRQDGQTNPVDVYVCLTDPDNMPLAQQIAGSLRGPGNLRVRVHMGGGALKKQMKRANACGASWAVLIGDEERARDCLTIKNLRTGEQTQDATSAAVATLLRACGSDAGEADNRA